VFRIGAAPYLIPCDVPVQGKRPTPGRFPFCDSVITITYNSRGAAHTGVGGAISTVLRKS
jgi:hypothetical protein